jgi:Type IV secretion system pilin
MKRLIMLALACLLFVAVFAPATTSAKDLFTSGSSAIDCTGATKDSAVCAEHDTTTDPASGNKGVLARVTSIVALVAGMAAVIMVIVGGVYYITANGDSGKITNARNTIMYALIGLVVIIVARALINFVVNKL